MVVDSDGCKTVVFVVGKDWATVIFRGWREFGS